MKFHRNRQKFTQKHIHSVSVAQTARERRHPPRKGNKNQATYFPRILLDSMSPWLPKSQAQKAKIVSAKGLSMVCCAEGRHRKPVLRNHPRHTSKRGTSLPGPFGCAEEDRPLQPCSADSRLQQDEEPLKNVNSSVVEESGLRSPGMAKVMTAQACSPS